MITASLRRLRGWKIAALLLGVPVLLAVVLGGWMKIVEVRKRTATERRMAELGEEPVPADPTRNPLLEKPAQGERWGDYADALAQLSGLKPGELRQMTQTLDNGWDFSSPPGKEAADRLLADFKGALDALCRGARRATAQGPVPDFYSEPIALLASLLRNQAGALFTDRPDEATDLLVVLLQFGVDLDAAASATAQEVIEKALNGIQARFSRVSRGRREPLEQALYQVERSLSLGRILKKDLRWLGSQALETNPDVLRFFDDKTLKTMKSDWRYGFSLNHLMVDSFGWMDRWVRELEAAEHLAYPPARARLLDLRNEIESCPNRIAKTLGVFMRGDERSYRGKIARIRLLRTACGVRGLADPYGALIRTTQDGDYIKMWSIGPDGVDDQGAGGWSDKGNRDIVIEVRKD